MGQVACPYCGHRYSDAEPVACCGEVGHCEPVPQATLDAEWDEADEALRDAAEEARFQQRREEGI